MEEKEIFTVSCEELLTQALHTGFISLRKMSELGMNENVSDEDVLQLLREFKDNDISIVIDKDQIPDKEFVKNVRKKIREAETDENRSRYEDPVKLYFDDLLSTEILNENEERDLVYEVADGNEDASEKLIESSLFIPASIAYDLIGKGVRYMDMVQEGNVELMLASSEFDYDSGISFYGYAAFRVSKWLKEVIEEAQSFVTVPNEMSQDAAKVITEMQKFREENNKAPTSQELADITGIDIKRVTEILGIIDGRQKSEQSEQTEEIKEIKEKEQPVGELHQLSMQIEEMLSILNEDEKEVIKCRFGLGQKGELSVEETSLKTGRTEAEVMSLEETAKKKLGMI